MVETAQTPQTAIKNPSDLTSPAICDKLFIANSLEFVAVQDGVSTTITRRTTRSCRFWRTDIFRALPEGGAHFFCSSSQFITS